MQDERIESLLRILNIPFEDGWPDLQSERNIYDYWRGLELISKDALAAVLSGAGGLVTNPTIERYFANVDALWPPNAYRGEPVVDVGSGYGHLTMWLALSGASHVHTVGDPQRVDFVMRLSRAAAEKNLIPRAIVSPRAAFVGVGDQTLSPTVEPGSVALVLLNDTLEHINPKARPWLFSASYSDLREGGRLVCRQHNTSSPTALARARQLWQRLEETEFVEQRSLLIAQLSPDLPAEIVKGLALATRGGNVDDVSEAVSSFRATGVVPAPLPDAAAVNPETGEPAEGHTTIAEVLAEMRAAGFRARAYPDMAASRRSRWLQGLARRFPGPFLRFHVFDQVSVFEATKQTRDGPSRVRRS